MAYDRYDSRRDREHERGFFEKAGDEIASWFGDDESERRRRNDEMDRNRDDDGWGRDPYWGRDSNNERGYDRERERSTYRGYQDTGARHPDYDRSGYEPMNWTSSDRDYRSSRPRSNFDRRGYDDYRRDTSPRGYGYGPSVHNPGTSYIGGYGYSRGDGPAYGSGDAYGSSGYGSGRSDYDRDFDRGRYQRSQSNWERDDYRNTSYAGSDRGNERHYTAWRQRQLNDLDRDYDQYCRERQERFESDFGAWRENRMNKRQQLRGIREHMDVVGNDGERVGKVDKVRGDHIILTKSDSDDNRHHAIDCSMVQSIEGDQVRLDVSASEAKDRWQETDNDRAFFGRDRDEETNLNRSFSGTYES